MANKKKNPSGGGAAASSSDTSFKIGDRIYDFKRKQFFVLGVGEVNVDHLLKEAPQEFDALCAKLVEKGSGFIHEITE